MDLRKIVIATKNTGAHSNRANFVKKDILNMLPDEEDGERRIVDLIDEIPPHEVKMDIGHRPFYEDVFLPTTHCIDESRQ